MAWTEEKFEALIQRLEKLARQQPATYRMRVGLLAVLGYVYIFAVIAGLLAVFAAIAWFMIFSGRIHTAMIKLAILVLIPALIALRSLWVTFPPPTGLPLSRQQAPQLFALLDELTTKLQAPRFHHVLVTEEFNAAVAQVPRLGMLGWQKNYLLLGLPLLQALSLEQFRAVLAHELGHLSGNHSRFSGWIYRVRKTYAQLFERLQHSEQQGSWFLFERFFNWHAPFFNAYSFVLARNNEYEADRCAAELAGANHAAAALINVNIQAQFLESAYWPKIYQQVEQQIEPPATAFTNLTTALRQPAEPATAKQWLNHALACKTDYADTHPCLSDRLSALGVSLSPDHPLTLPQPVSVSAARVLLGSTLTQLTAHFDRQWQEQMATSWRQRYAHLQECQKQLQVLETQAQSQPLTLEAAWERARLTLEVRDSAAAIPLLEAVLTMDPEHAAAHYTLGQVLLEQQEAAGIEHIEKAIAARFDWASSGYELILNFLYQQGQTEQIQIYQKRAEQHYETLMLARRERSSVQASDEFQAHDYSAEAIKSLVTQLARYDQLKEAYLVRKVMHYFPEEAFYVLAVKRQQRFWETNSDQVDQKFIDQIADGMEFPEQTYILLLNKHTKNREKKLRQVAPTAIYRR
ncbi:M48 family metalloprotease [Trichocoleus sp. FACHB-591]|uniref:M48 family metallopeptidase n=1 Tax=Trichocoleus sp. FACHB-591 TaxID=2692872 RepID=UPI001686FE12|nr:M48 family metallopeptidase [Trichocoleus sp. FACHB-591]MBD2093833.1 M48 family metalloprotease [Trichocoleus sp. FACHB-591]